MLLLQFDATREARKVLDAALCLDRPFKSLSSEQLVEAVEGKAGQGLTFEMPYSWELKVQKRLAKGSDRVWIINNFRLVNGIQMINWKLHPSRDNAQIVDRLTMSFKLTGVTTPEGAYLHEYMIIGQGDSTEMLADLGLVEAERWLSQPLHIFKDTAVWPDSVLHLESEADSLHCRGDSIRNRMLLDIGGRIEPRKSLHVLH